MNITAPIRRHARISPATPAIIRGDNSIITYAVLEHAIDRMAAYALQAGLKAGDIVGAAPGAPDEAVGLTLILALARIGVASASMFAPREAVRLRFQSGGDVAPGDIGYGPSWMAREPAGPDHVPVPMHNDAGTIFRVFSSSGTTGLYKHIMVSHHTMTQRVLGRWIAEGSKPAVRIVGLGLGFNWGMESVLRTLWAGGTLVLVNGRELAGQIERHRVTSICASPYTVQTILEQLPATHRPFPLLERIEIGGSRMPEPLLHMARERVCPDLVSTLGSGECGGIASAPFEVLAQHPNAAGYVWQGVEVVAFDESGNPLPPGEEGVLRLRGDRVASGYLGGSATAGEGFRDGWFHSSDVGAVRPDGMLILTGRTNDVINVGGNKIHPHVIEAMLLRIPTVTDAAVFGVPDETGMTRVGAAIVAQTELSEAVLADVCRNLATALSPELIVQVRSIPRNENGKIQRDILTGALVQIQSQGESGQREGVQGTGA